MKKRGLEFSFAWLFAIIVGAFILFLAIFAVSKIISLGETEVDAKTGKEFGIILNPLESGAESATSNYITMPVESRIYNKCNLEGNWGRQIIQVSQKSFNKWSQTNIDVGFSNKYLFSENYVEGKKFYLFSKPLEFPFKVSDLIIVTKAETKYCFIDAPEEIKDDISRLKQGNLLTENCSSKTENLKICFQSYNSCNVIVDYQNGVVKKGQNSLYFEGDALMFAAIFSDKDIYECQLKRLMKRTKNLALIYIDKGNFVSKVDCNSNLDTELSALISASANLKSSQDLSSLKLIVDELNDKNSEAICKLW